jgi:hypothetical protein
MLLLLLLRLLLWGWCCWLLLLPSQVMQLVEKPRDPPLQYIIADTPGQIEIFTWSASGQLITDLLASRCVVVVVVVVVAGRPRGGGWAVLHTSLPATLLVWLDLTGP